MNNTTVPVYQLLNVSKDYSDRRVVDIDKLNIHEWETLAVVGPSGSGKSTLLRMLNFIESSHKWRADFSWSEIFYKPGDAPGSPAQGDDRVSASDCPER